MIHKAYCFLVHIRATEPLLPIAWSYNTQVFRGPFNNDVWPTVVALNKKDAIERAMVLGSQLLDTREVTVVKVILKHRPGVHRDNKPVRPIRLEA